MNATSILVIRPSAIGDVVMAQPIVEGLKRKYPNARITWMVCPESVPLLKGNPDIQRLIVWNKNGWRKLRKEWKVLALWQALRAFLRDLRQERFDLVLDLQGQFRTRLFARLAKATERIGFKSKEPGEWLMTRTITSDCPNRDMGNEYFYLLEQLGIDTRGILPRLVLSEEDKAGARRVLEAAGITGGYVVFAPFTTRPQKHWLNERWVELALKFPSCGGVPEGASPRGRGGGSCSLESTTLALSRHPSTGGEFKVSLLWLGGPADANAAEALAKEGGGVSLAGKAKLGESAAIVAGARCVVGVDTGLTHIGTAFARPTVILFGPTCPYDSTERTPHTTVLYHRQPCSPCRRTPTCHGDFTCMKAISVQEIMAALQKEGNQL